jgi:hypothetical protein
MGGTTGVNGRAAAALVLLAGMCESTRPQFWQLAPGVWV